MKPALLTKNRIVLAMVLAVVFALPNGVKAAAGGLQVCAPNATCEIGEFLFDDDYVPITTATCTLTSKYPDATAHLTSQAMTSESDGWYSHTFTAPGTTNLQTLSSSYYSWNPLRCLLPCKYRLCLKLILLQ